MENILYNFLTIEEVREARPGLTLYDDYQVQEALNMTMDLLDSECNGLIVRVIQYSLGREVKDESNPLYRTTQELEYLKRAFIAQTQFTINLRNDQTSGNNSLSMGGLSISSNRNNSFNQVAPGVYENLQRARVYKMNDAFKGGESDRRVLCLEKLFLTREEASEYVRYFQPEAAENSILVVNSSHLIRPMKTQDIEWKTKKADTILDRDNVYRNIWEITNLAFFGENGTDAMTRQQIYQAIWNAMWYNNEVAYPNEAIVRIYDNYDNKVYTFKSNRDGNKGHNPLRDNKDEFWWKRVEIADTINYEDVADLVINSKEFLNKINAINKEITSQMEALWEQIKDNPHLLKKFEELYDQTKTENDQLEEKLNTKIESNTNAINDLDKENIAYINKTNNFLLPQNFWDGNKSLIQLLKANSVDSQILNPNGKLIIGGKKGVEFNSSIHYDSSYPITDENQLTTKKYVDNAINNASEANINWDNIDTPTLNIHNDNSNISYNEEKVELKKGSNYIRVHDNGGLFDLGDTTVSISNGQFTILNSNNLVNPKYVPTDPNSITTKDYVDRGIVQYTDAKIEQELKNYAKRIDNFWTFSQRNEAWSVGFFRNALNAFTKSQILNITIHTSTSSGQNMFITTKLYYWENNDLYFELNSKVPPQTPAKAYVTILDDLSTHRRK